MSHWVLITINQYLWVHLSCTELQYTDSRLKILFFDVFLTPRVIFRDVAGNGRTRVRRCPPGWALAVVSTRVGVGC